MSDESLERLAAELRIDVLRMVLSAGSGHIDSSFSVMDIVATLYFGVMNIRPSQPDWPDRDRFVLSKGHAAPALYAVLARAGYFRREDLQRLRQPGSHLQGHPRTTTPGVDSPSGSLGQGLSIAVGMALALKLDPRSSSRVFAVLSDGELDEGQTWEAIAFAGNRDLDNLVAVVDHNGRQYSTRSNPAFAPSDLADKLVQFGWDAHAVDGHSITALRGQLCRSQKGPRFLVARTIKGRGVSFMEDTQHWHGKVPDPATGRRALAELLSACTGGTAAGAAPADPPARFRDESHA